MGLGPTLLAVSWTEFVVVSILFAARFYVNAVILQRFKADFWWATLTYVTAIVAQVFLVLTVHWGLGERLQDLTAHQVVRNQYYQWVFTTIAIIAIALGKLTIIVFILQFERTQLKNRRVWFLYVVAVLTILVNVAIIPILWTQCSPMAKIWDDEIPGNCAGRAINEKYGYFQGSFGVFVDLSLALYPMVAFWNLKMRRDIKVGLAALFGCGVVAAICSAVKTKALSTLTATSDLTYELGRLNIWASTEMWIILMVSCIPPTRPLFVRFIRTIRSISCSSRDTDENGGPTTVYLDTVIIPSKKLPLTTTNESEENILEREGIMMTRNITVQYEESGEATPSRDEPERVQEAG